MKEVLPGTIERVGKHFRELRMRADIYSQALVRICEDREVEYFIVAKQHRNLMNCGRSRRATGSDWMTTLTRKAVAAAQLETEDHAAPQAQLAVQGSA